MLGLRGQRCDACSRAWSGDVVGREINHMGKPGSSEYRKAKTVSPAALNNVPKFQPSFCFWHGPNELKLPRSNSLGVMIWSEEVVFRCSSGGWYTVAIISRLKGSEEAVWEELLRCIHQHGVWADPRGVGVLGLWPLQPAGSLPLQVCNLSTNRGLFFHHTWLQFEATAAVAVSAVARRSTTNLIMKSVTGKPIELAVSHDGGSFCAFFFFSCVWLFFFF